MEVISHIHAEFFRFHARPITQSWRPIGGALKVDRKEWLQNEDADLRILSWRAFCLFNKKTPTCHISDRLSSLVYLPSSYSLSHCSDFGGKVIKMKSLVQAIPTLLSHSDKNVREETKQMAIEIYKWIRDAIKPQLQNIKPVQVIIILWGKRQNKWLSRFTSGLEMLLNLSRLSL